MDFGLTASKDLDEVLSKKVYGTERRGTLPYLAPEARARSPPDLPSGLGASSRATLALRPRRSTPYPPTLPVRDAQVLRQRSTGLPSDMWALGVVLFMTLGGYHPFDAKGEADLKETTANIRAQEPDFDDPLWEGVSDPAKHLLLGLLCKDPAERLTIEQLLQHPWVTSGGAAAGKALRGRVAGQSDPTAGLRAAVFATILHQQVQESQFWRNRTQRSKQLRKKGSLRARMLDSELLSKAFSEFDNEGKGYITEKDLRRVLGGWGQQEATQAIKTMLEGGATGGDREGSRVTYGNYISMSTRITSNHAPPTPKKESPRAPRLQWG